MMEKARLEEAQELARMISITFDIFEPEQETIQFSNSEIRKQYKTLCSVLEMAETLVDQKILYWRNDKE